MNIFIRIQVSFFAGKYILNANVAYKVFPSDYIRLYLIPHEIKCVIHKK